ncbi:hypothetical protein CAPTEDRAFT_190374 [Capitella teleta]|uniref:Uncharacterized protein n=1 Tax=Capitella teleta TaxID=283909 RepID=R7VH27_CAPTE|nr:hypothetical protein CAPTEDRAFT_190374 [Capitella teleta]|eukprot:ELU18133.1 hypothetical protein CAPTEDRAFT_190374 [Capitella teleta]
MADHSRLIVDRTRDLLPLDKPSSAAISNNRKLFPILEWKSSNRSQFTVDLKTPRAPTYLPAINKRVANTPHSKHMHPIQGLGKKNMWLLSAKNLKKGRQHLYQPGCPTHPKKIYEEKSLAIEETLHRNRKKAAKVIYSRIWPYITLKHGDGSYYLPRNCADDLVRHFYGQDINIDDIDINDML